MRDAAFFPVSSVHVRFQSFALGVYSIHLNIFFDQLLVELLVVGKNNDFECKMVLQITIACLLCDFFKL